jgi:hypothetical protein
MADDEEIRLIKLFKQDTDIADILCNRMKFYIYTEIIDCIQNLKDEDLKKFNIICVNYDKDFIKKKDDKIKIFKGVHYIEADITFYNIDYISFIYNKNIKLIIDLNTTNTILLLSNYNNYIKDINDIIEKINNNKKYLKYLKIILKSIFLTNYIDINNIYAITCINIYLFKMNIYNENKDKYKYNENDKINIILTLLARLTLLTNVFYLNNYTNYLGITFNKDASKDNISDNLIDIFKKIISNITYEKFKEFKKLCYITEPSNEEDEINFINEDDTFVEYNFKGGKSPDDFLDKSKLYLNDPTYLLNYIPMNNSKRNKLTEFIQKEIDKIDKIDK